MANTQTNNKIAMGLAPFLVVFAGSIGVRWLMQPPQPIQPAQAEPAAVVSAEPTQAVEPTQTQLDRDNLSSPFRDDARSIGSFLVDTVRGRAWTLSKLPEDEVNNICWLVRVEIQSIKDKFDNTTALEPTQFAGHEQLLLDDQVCKLARHYQLTGVGPARAYIDISSLEGVPADWRTDDG